MKEGAVPWTKQWNGIPRNVITKRAYRGINILLLWERGFESCEWLTYRQAMELGAPVRKGEHGTRIVYLGRTEAKDDEKAYRFLKPYVVFNGSQLEGYELYVPERGDLTEFVASIPATVIHGGDIACYVPSRDEIHLPHMAAFESESAYWSTRLHESAHWSGSERRLNRSFGKFGTQAYAAEELVAELTSAFLCESLGVQGELHHAGYLSHWIKLLTDQPTALMSAASQATLAADYLRSFDGRFQGGESEDTDCADLRALQE